MARIENHKYSIEEAFRECFYIVPDYQREYVWTDKDFHPRNKAISAFRRVTSPGGTLPAPYTHRSSSLEALNQSR